MKVIILLYLYLFTSLDIAVRIFYGSIEGGLHPAVLIRGFIVLMLISHFVFNQKKSWNRLTVRFVYIYLIAYTIHFVIIELGYWQGIFVVDSIKFFSKILLLALLLYYLVYYQYYYKRHIGSIITFNLVIYALNVLIGYHLGIGFQSYSAIQDSFRGFLAGNDTSIFSAVFFAYTLYNPLKLKKVYILPMTIIALYLFYIISTKAIFVAAFILLMYYAKYLRKIKTTILITILFVFIIIIFSEEIAYFISDRFLKIYDRQIETGLSYLNTSDYNLLFYLNYISPYRILLGYEYIIFILNESILYTLLGYGVEGIYYIFGRPPMMDVFVLLSMFGLFFTFAAYYPVYFILKYSLKNKINNFYSISSIAVVIYGFLGGFVFGAANTITLLAILFIGILYNSKGKLSESFNSL